MINLRKLMELQEKNDNLKIDHDVLKIIYKKFPCNCASTLQVTTSNCERCKKYQVSFETLAKFTMGRSNINAFLNSTKCAMNKFENVYIYTHTRRCIQHMFKAYDKMRKKSSLTSH